MVKFNEDGDLVIENERVVFRQVGWQGQTGKFYDLNEDWKATEKGGVTPIYIQVSPE